MNDQGIAQRKVMFRTAEFSQESRALCVVSGSDRLHGNLLEC